MTALATLLLLAASATASAAAPAAAPLPPPVYLWFEPEWFDGVEGNFAYWTGTAKPTGRWGVAGPGISPEWTQGGESEWNSMGVPAEETRAACRRDFIVPRGGAYRLWVRYVDHRKKTEPFKVQVVQPGRPPVAAELGVRPAVPVNDEYQLYWGFSFAWASFEGSLAGGPATLTLSIDRAGEAWRQVDAVLLTDDLAYQPVGRDKPPFAYFASFGLAARDGARWRGTGTAWPCGSSAPRVPLAGRDFTLWTTVEGGSPWWTKQNPDALSAHDVLFEHSPPADIRKEFQSQFAGRKDLPILDWPGLRPGFYLGSSPDLSPGTPLRRWLERTRSPFYILTNYASGNYTEKTGPATYQALTGPLAGQFLGYIHGEAVGTGGVSLPEQPLASGRRPHVDALAPHLRRQQADAWSKIYKTQVDEAHWSRGIPCLSTDTTALAHLFHDSGARVVGYELDATNLHVPMRLAFHRGAARQYGAAFLNYASGNFGDACNYFTQEPRVPRGAKSWFHSKYAVTDGVSAAWYRKLYYLNYTGGASAIFWEQGLENQWLKPGPGTHPVQMSPFGRATEEFLATIDRIPDRGEPYTPVALLLSHGHAYDRVNNPCKMLHVFREDAGDRELRELFNVCWHPTAITEGQPAAPDVQSMPGGLYGNIFDVLVDRPARSRAILDYPVVWAAGDVDLSGPWLKSLEEYLQRGGTLVLCANAAGPLPEAWLGWKGKGRTVRAEEWRPDEGEPRSVVPYEIADVEVKGARVLAWASPGVPLVTRQAVGPGAVVTALVPRLVGLDERAHPVLPYLMNSLTAGLVPVQVARADGRPLSGEVLWQLNRTRDGWLLVLISTRGIDKTQHGVARVDRRAACDLVLRLPPGTKTVREYTEPGDLPVQGEKNDRRVSLRLQPGDVQVLGLVTGP